VRFLFPLLNSYTSTMSLQGGDRYCPSDEIFMSDSEDDFDLDEAYEFAIENPLLSSILNHRIVDILPESSTEADIPTSVNTEREKLHSLIHELQTDLSFANDEITYLVHDNHNKQNQLDFLHSILEPPLHSVGLGGHFSSSNSHETLPLPTMGMETTTSEIACQTEEGSPSPSHFMAASADIPKSTDYRSEVPGWTTRVSRTSVVSQNHPGRSSLTILPRVESNAGVASQQLEAAYARFNSSEAKQTFQEDPTDESTSSLVSSILSTIIEIFTSTLE